MHLRSIAFSCAAFALALSGCSGSDVALSRTQVGAQTWQLVAGGSAQSEALQTADYYPNAITIDAGDTIVWTNTAVEPHVVAIPPPGQSLPPGPPQPKVGGNVFDGSTYVSSGFFNKGATYAVTFTKAGTYKVYCLIHQPEMVATVTVAPVGSAYPKAQSEYTSIGSADFKIDIDAAAASVLAFPYPIDGTTLAAGIAPGAPSGPPAQSSVVRFLHGKTLDQTTTIAVGTTLVWSNISQFPHTVTFPIVGGTVAPGPPTQPAAGGTTYDGSTFTNSGVLVPGSKFSLTFTKPGTYAYVCLFHDEEGMAGTVIVI